MTRGRGSAVDLPMVLTPDGPVPIYLQIKYQISYLITSGQLTVGDKLPPVRAVADGLAVNPGTVAQAYRELQHEGLIEAAVGRGTYVAATIPLAPDSAVRQREAARVTDAAIDRLRALALSDADIRYRFETALNAAPPVRQVVLAAPTEAVGRKYAASLSRALGPELKSHVVTYTDLERSAAHVKLLLELCYFVITFASSVRRVELALEPFGAPFRVLGMTTELQSESVARLKELDASRRVLLYSEERYAHQSLGLVLKHSPLTADAVELVTLESTPLPVFAATTADLIIHTFGASAVLDAHQVPKERRQELKFDVVPASIDRLRSVLFPA